MKKSLLGLALLTSFYTQANDCLDMEGLYTCEDNAVIFLEKIGSTVVPAYRITGKSISGVLEPRIFILDNKVRKVRSNNESAICVGNKLFKISNDILNDVEMAPYTKTYTYKLENNNLQVTSVIDVSGYPDKLETFVKNCQKL
ncbi:MAG: hypothetical protein HOO06_16455 [Bdellovibrionaceae bacterium]|jgi:hypothetical protein|nr:hypothetical protein [Pseudobdellovibrionaceae bacterium]